MDLFVGIAIGFLACLIVTSGWIIAQIKDATKAYDSAIAKHEKTLEMLSQAQNTTEEGA